MRHLSIRLIACLCALAIAGLGAANAAAADDAKALSARLSDEAFALLTSVSAGHDTPSPVLGPVGVFAADSQKLSSALQSSDQRGAGVAMAALRADAAAVDKAAGPKGIDAAKWAAIKHDLDALSAMVPAASAGAVAAASAESSASAAPAESSASAAPAASSESSSGPVVRIESAQMAGGDVLRLKGYMSGHGIRSAGIYLGDTRLGKLNVEPTPGEQTIRFDLQIHNPAQGSVLRLYDSAGHMAQAPIPGIGPIVERGAAMAPMPAPNLDSPAPGLDSDDNVALGSGDDFSREMKALVNAPPSSVPETNPPTSVPESNPAAEGASGGNTEEIPSATPPPSGPKLRMRSHLKHGPNDIAIRIDNLTMVDPGIRDYLVKGQITGSDLKRAGIYVDGRLAEQLPLNSGAGFRTTDFAQSFTATGSEATIRVYRSRRDYTETSLNLATASTGSGSTAPAVINSPIGGALGGYAGVLNPGQLAVQITSVQAAAPSLYVVSGIITGHNIASAGIYQNGMLAQPLSLSSSSGGIGGLITRLIPGMSNRVSFVGRFNPALGFATVRAYDRSGLMAEQPIVAGATGYGLNPYGAMNPYGALNPYGAVNPYMTNPYTGMSPYTGAPGIGLAPGSGRLSAHQRRRRFG